MILTNILAPVWIYYHLTGLRLSLVPNSVTITQRGWVTGRDGLARRETSIAPRHHYAVYLVELNLVLLVERMKIETCLATIDWLVELGKINVFVGDCSTWIDDAVFLGLSWDFSSWKSRNVLMANYTAWILWILITWSRFRTNVACLRLKLYLSVDMLWRWCAFFAYIRIFAFVFGVDRLMNVLPPCSYLI